MAFRDVASAELSALIDRLTAAAAADAETSAKRVHAEAEAAVKRLQMETEAAGRRVQLEADAKVEAIRKDLAQAVKQVETLRNQLSQETKQRESLRNQIAQDAKQVETLRTQLATAAKEQQAAHEQEAAARRALEADVKQARAGVDAARGEAATFAKQAETEATERARLGTALTAAQKELQTLTAQHQNDLVQAHRDVARLVSQPLDRLLTAFKALSQAASIDDILATLAEGLATEFPRVALFDVNGNRLEGVNQVGFDFKSDISKVVIPLTMDSVLAQAVKSGRVQGFTATELNDGSRSLFGGSPVFVLVLPITVSGEIAAVIYADDSGQPATEAASPERRVKFAEILLWYAVPMLARLSTELKALSELRDYVTLLLSEIEHVYNADVGARIKDEERRSRLQENLQSSREIYSRRVEGGGPAAAALLEEQLTKLIASRSGTPFGRELAAVSGRAQSAPHRVRAQRTAEAS